MTVTRDHAIDAETIANERTDMLRASAADGRTEILLGDSVDAYETEALRFAFFPQISRPAHTDTFGSIVHEELPIYPALAMLGEIGELAEKIDETAAHKDVIKELGDVLWYVAAASRVLGLGLVRVVEPRPGTMFRSSIDSAIAADA